MPYIEIKTSASLDEVKKTELKTALGGIITRIPGKSEEVTMIGLLDNVDLYLGGIKLNPGAYVEVKMYKEATFESKAAVTEGIYELLKDSLDIKNENIYITFYEHQEWGARGSLK